MSIIHDALNKVQKAQKTIVPGVADPSVPSLPGDTSTSRILNKTILLALGLLMTLIFTVFWMNHPVIAPQPAGQPSSVAHLNTPLGSTPLAEPVDPLAQLRIQGIMDTGVKKAALINGHVYEEGQQILNHKIVQITLDTVTVISRNGHTRTLRVDPARP